MPFLLFRTVFEQTTYSSSLKFLQNSIGTIFLLHLLPMNSSAFFQLSCAISFGDDGVCSHEK